MSSKLLWRPLTLPASSGLPSLLAAIQIGSSAYTLQVTDLANIWTESLDRKAICRRGWDQNTSVDPSDTSENMSTFLTYLRSALDASHTGHERTSMSLSPGTVQDCGQDGLLLKITCDIPGLAPLKWPAYLRKCTPSSLATSLVFPLVEAQHARTVELKLLKQALIEKDAVLTKVLDKLEATGTGLDQVFNVLTGRKKVTRAAAEAKVKGLAPFHSNQWERQIAKDPDFDIKSPGDLVQIVFGGSGLQYPDGLDINGSDVLDTWWHNFKPTSAISLHIPQDQFSTSTKTSHRVLDGAAVVTSDAGEEEEKQDDEGDDEFQVQTTPPRKKNAIASGSLGEEDSTADEDDNLDPPSAIPSGLQGQQGAAKKLVPRIGTIGGRLAKAERSSLGQKPVVAARASVEPETNAIDQTVAPQDGTSETASEDEGDQSNLQMDAGATASLPDSTASGSDRAVQKRDAANDPSPMVALSDSCESEGDHKPRVARKIGLVGGKAAPTHRPSHNKGVSNNHQGDPCDSCDGKKGPESMGTVGSVPHRMIGLIGGVGGDRTTRSRPLAHSATSEQDAKMGIANRGRHDAGAGADSSKGVAKRETSQERVARKRDEMKIELEKKAAAGPAKKKRRF